jgi:myosin-5
MEVGAFVWYQDPEHRTSDEAWLLSEIISVAPDLLTLDKSPKQLSLPPASCFLANTQSSSSSETATPTHDLITLPHLHEPAILHALHTRFSSNIVYTFCGPILIAVNPFQRFPVYTDEILATYRNEGILTSNQIIPSNPLPPHVYSIADTAYRDMNANSLSQSILISGESGAGKTVSLLMS